MTGELWVEARSHFDQGSDIAADRYLAGSRRVDFRQEPEQSALAGAIPPHDAHAVAGVYPERDVAQGPELGAGHRRLAASSRSRTAHLIEYCLSE